MRRLSTEAMSLESKINSILKKEFPTAKSISVADISGGCGAMFEVVVKSGQFNGLSKVKQHMKVVNVSWLYLIYYFTNFILYLKVLKSEIKDMHGIRIFTSSLND